ncbi:MAG: CDP-alcohol phosphatidyltransferase family protein [Pseudolysinimonas sp.]
MTPWSWVVGGIAVLALFHVLPGLSVAGWAAGIAYLVVSTTVLIVGLARRSMERLGAANAITATRSMLVGVVTALTVTSFTQPVPAWLVVALTVPALMLDAVDGWVARRTGSVSVLGARFDMEVDAFLLLVLGAFDVRTFGVWVLAIGLMRYAYVAAGWVAPWLRATVPPRYWRKVVAAICGIALTLGASGLAPHPAAVVAIAVALALLVESFGRDVIWLFRTRAGATAPPPPRPRPAEQPRSAGSIPVPARPRSR